MSIEIFKFCARKDECHHREFMRQLFEHNGFIYAANGHILIRVVPEAIGFEIDIELKNNKWNAGQKQRVVNIFDLSKHKESTPRIFLDSILCEPKIKVCDECFGAGCDNCDYEGQWEITQYIEFENYTLNRRYVSMISRLPIASIGVSEKETETPIPFFFNGGQGLVMPIRPSAKLGNVQKYKEVA